jgi:hypothetical protein
MNSNPSNFQHKLNAVMKTEPKKAVALAVLITVLAVMVGRFLLGNSNPKSARASVTSKASSAIGKNAAVKSSAPRRGGATAALLKWSEASVPPISRNLFTVRTEYFPKDGSGTSRSGSTEAGFWSNLEKSLALRADQRVKQDNLIANYKAQAADLKIQSIVMGPQPRAMVNGQMVTEGDVVAGFRVLKIEARRMIIEREGIRLEIQMK